MKVLYIVRGISGAGKTTFANTLDAEVVSADDYFYVNGEYRFNKDHLKLAHLDCRNRTEDFMQRGYTIAVANTFTRQWEMQEYFNLAEKYGYKVFSLIVENYHGGKNVHNVPSSSVQAQKDRFEVRL